MATKAQKAKVGLFLLVCLTIAVGIVLLVTGFRGEKSVPYYMKFSGNVSGLSKGGDVEFRGVKVGTVDTIQVTDEGVVVVKITVRPSIATLREGVKATLASRGISGIVFIQLSGGEKEAPKLPEGATIEVESSFLEDLKEKAVQTFDRLNAVADQASVLVSDLDSLVNALKTGDERYAIGSTVKNLNALLGDITSGNKDSGIGGLVFEFKSVLSRVDEMLPSVQRNMRVTQYQLNMMLDEFRATMASVRALAEMLETDPAALLRGKSAPRE